MAKEEAARGGPGRPGRPGDAVGGRSTLSFPETSWARNLMRQAPPRVGLVKLRPGARHALPAYGVASLAAYLARHADCETLVTDLSDGGPEDWEKTPDFLLNVGFAWDLLVVDVDLEARDALRTLYDWCARLAAARRVNPGITLVVTGHLPSTRPEDAAAHPGALFVKGEAEQTLLDILRARRGEMDLRQVRGLAFAEGGEIVRTPAREILAATEIPSPTFNTWAALGGDYRPLGSLAERTATARMGVIRVTRGGGRRGSRRWEIFGPEERRKPIDRVLLEIDNYNALGATELVFDDDRLLADRGHAEETLSALGEQGGRPPCSFPCGFTFEGTPPDLLDRLATLTPCHVLIGPAEGLGGWRALLADEVRRREARELLSRAAGLGLLVHTTVPAGWPDAGEGELDRLVDLLSVGEIHGVEVMPWPESFAADGLGQPYDLAALDRLLALSLDRLTTSASVERMSAFGVRPAEAFVLNPAQHWKSLRAEVSRDG